MTAAMGPLTRAQRLPALSLLTVLCHTFSRALKPVVLHANKSNQVVRISFDKKKAGSP